MVQVSALPRPNYLSTGAIATASFLRAAEATLNQEIPRLSTDEMFGEASRLAKTLSTLSDKPTEKMTRISFDTSTKHHYFDLTGHRRRVDERRRKEVRKQEEKIAEEERREQTRRTSIIEAQEFLEEFIRTRWETNFSHGHVKIHCNLTMDEIKDLGNLDKANGSRACRKLITAPVIHDAIGHALWMDLHEKAIKEEMGKKPESSLAIGHERPNISTTKDDKRKWSHFSTHHGEEELPIRRTRSMTRRATVGDISARDKRSRSAYEIVLTTERNRRKSDMPLVRADQVMCMTCGCRAMGSIQPEDDVKEEEEEEEDEEEEKVEEITDKKRHVISRRLSAKMSKKLTALGGGVASGYGGSRLIA